MHKDINNTIFLGGEESYSNTLAMIACILLNDVYVLLHLTHLHNSSYLL